MTLSGAFCNILRPEVLRLSFSLCAFSLLDDFTFQFTDGESYTESKEMEWFIETYGTFEATEEEEELFAIRQKVGMVFQNPDNQMIASIIEDEIAFGPENLGVPREEIGKRIEYALSAVGMTEYRHNTPYKLSGGQKQRIAIAAVLAMRPEVLVLDESTAMLDPKGRAEVLKVAHELNDQGITIVLITHFMEEATQADRVVVMSEGRVVMDGTPEEIFRDRASIEKYDLELPITDAIAADLLQAGLPLEDKIYSEKTLAEAICRLK